MSHWDYIHMNAVALEADKFDDVFNDPNYVSQEKLQGIRAFLYIGEPTIIVTRGGKDVSNNFPHIVRHDFHDNLTGCVLDGELWERGIPDEIVSGYAMRKIGHAPPGIRFHAFDIVQYQGMECTELSQRDRLNLLSFVMERFPEEAGELIPTWEDNHEQHLLDVWAKGGEGLILKNLNAEYRQGKRHRNIWFKIKSTQDYDVVILGFTEGNGKYKDMIGSFRYGMYVGGTLTVLGACSGITDELRRDMTENKDKYIGTVVRVKAAGQDRNSGALIEPRFDCFRLDKKPEECVWVP